MANEKQFLPGHTTVILLSLALGSTVCVNILPSSQQSSFEALYNNLEKQSELGTTKRKRLEEVGITNYPKTWLIVGHVDELARFLLAKVIFLSQAIKANLSLILSFSKIIISSTFIIYTYTTY